MLSIRILFVSVIPAIVMALLFSPASAQQTAPDPIDQAIPVAAITTLPQLESSIHDAMQSRSYDDAMKLIETELEKNGVVSPDYLRYLQGVALTQAKRYDEAIAALEQLEKDHPESVWLSRSRFGRAHVLVLRRQYIDAGAIYAAEAERLLSRGRKDELAKIYLEFADRYYDGVPAADPSQAKQPDLKQALTYYSEALKLGPSAKLRQTMEFKIARCQEELNQHAEAIASFEKFLSQYAGVEPKSGIAAPSELVAEASYRLGGVQLKSGSPAVARKTWQDLVSKWTDVGDDPQHQVINGFLAKAEYRLAQTYGLPKPKSVGDLELAVTAAEKFLAKHPEHELAPQAELEIAQGYSRHKRHAQAVTRLLSLIDNAKYKAAEQIAVAREMLGQEYLAQEQFDEAIAAWKLFLEQHPTDPKWPSVQTRIVDTEFAKAEHARKLKKYDEARTLWQTFLNQYPLDSRAASVLFRFGEMKSVAGAELHQSRVDAAIERGESAQSVVLGDDAKTLFEEAITDWQRVFSKYPNGSEASQAAFSIASTYEFRLGKLKDALHWYKKANTSTDANGAARIAILTSPELTLITERKFRTDEKPRIKLTTRNLEKVTVKAYRIDMTDYFRKMHLATGIESLDIALIDPDSQFEYVVKDYEEYKQIDGDIELPIEGAGVTAVTVSSDKLEATTMVVVSDIDIIVKSSRNEMFLFAENMREGKPAVGVSVLVSDGSKVFSEEVTGDDGILQKCFAELKSVKDLRVFAVHEGHMASTVNNLKGLDFAVGLTPRGYLYTDRPAYRSGQLVNIKAIVRWVDGDRFTFKPGEKFTLAVDDANGRQLKTEEVTLSAYGSVHSHLMLPESAIQGDYRVSLHRVSTGEDDTTGSIAFNTKFRVTEYKLEPVELAFDIGKDVYFRGEKISGTIKLQYYYGTPLANEEIQYRLGADGELITARTDAEGKVTFEFETTQFSESQPLSLHALSPQRNVSAAHTVFLATRGFAITSSTLRGIYINGESFEALFNVADPAGKPVRTKLRIEVLKLTNAIEGFGEKLVETHEVTTNADTGNARQTLVLAEPGLYLIRAIGSDQFGNQVSVDRAVKMSGDKDTTRLRILADRHSFKVGESAEVNLHWREKPAIALVTFEGAKVLSHRLVQIASGDNRLQIPMEADFAPNVFLSVAVMQRNALHSAQSEFQVAQNLRVILKPDQATLKPGEDLSVQVEVTDPQGNPVAAELSLGLVQTNLLNKFTDIQGAIDAFFGAGHRKTAVRQSTSCTFDYRPKTKGITNRLAEYEELAQRIQRESQAEALQVPAFGASGYPVIASEAIVDDVLTQSYPARSGRVMFGGVVNSDAGIQGGYGLPKDNAHIQSYDVNAPAVGDTQLRFTPELGVIVIRGAKRDVDRVRAVIDQIEANPNDPATWEDSGLNFARNISINGLTNEGRFLAFSGNGRELAERLARQDGIQLLPAMADAETAFWDPTITTDENGRATMTITMPTRSTAWRLRAKGIDNGVLAGEATTDIVTKKNLFAEMKLPLAFTVGDKAIIPVEIHHGIDGQRSLKVTLKTTLGEKSVEQSKTIDVSGPGISKLAFDVEIEAAKEARFELAVRDGDEIADESTLSVVVRPYGFPIYSTSSGTSSQSTVALIELDKKLQAEGGSLEILIGADVNRALVESVLGSGAFPLFECGLPPSSPTERSISDILGGVAVLAMNGQARDADTPQAQALTNRIASAVTQLTSSQHAGGGFAATGLSTTGTASPLLSARVMWALATARQAGFSVPQDAFDKGKSYLQSSFANASQSELETQTILLHAMAVAGCGDFAFANRLHRERNRMNTSGLAHLSLTLAAMNRKEMASDLVDLMMIPAGDAGIAYRQQLLPWMRNDVELRAMILLALQAVAPDHVSIAALAKSLLAARVGSRFPVEKSNGPAIAALAHWQSRTQPQSGKYTLAISVNDTEVETLSIDPRQDSGRRVRVPDELLRLDRPNRIEFKLDGRASFSYSAVMTGFVAAGKIASTTKDWLVERRYEPAPRVVDGKAIPRGFGVLSGSYTTFVNPLTQLPVGDIGEVTLSPRRVRVTGNRDEKYDYLVLTESIPAGCIVLDGSVKGEFERFEIEPGQITFYIGDRRYPTDIHYSLLGYLPGEFQVPQAILRSFYEPALFAVSKVAELEVLAADGVSKDEYRQTPDELYHMGELAFEKGNFATAHELLTQLFTKNQLRDDPYRKTVQWLFASSLAQDNHGDTVAYFEILKEKFPEIEISFEDILRVAKSYREIGEYERSYLVYRATVEGSFERESQVAGFLNARGEFVLSVAAMERLLRDYPAESYVATATYALAQETYRRAPHAKDDAVLKAAGFNRVHLINAAIQMLDHFVTTWPEDPADDQASFALATALLDLEKYQAAITRCEKYAERYPSSKLLDAFWYIIGYCHFEMEQPQEALAMCRKVAEATFPNPETGGTRVAENRWEAIYIMGQIYHSLGQAASAIDEYTKVSERFADASEAIKFFSRKEIALDEVTSIKPAEAKQVELRFRNISEVALKVYRIDLMKFGLMQRNLDRITAINLAGIKPYHEHTIPLGDGKDYRDRELQLTLPLKDEGAYLIVCRGENLYASGLVLVSPLELTVQEDAKSGRVRVTVNDSSKDAFANDVHVKVIGSANDDFVSGDTDLRGLMIADDIKGTSTVIAVRDRNRYAFYRGKSSLQNVPRTPAADPFGSSVDDPFGSDSVRQEASSAPAKPSQTGKGLLRDNLFRQNDLFQQEQKMNYDGLLNNDRSGIKSKEAF